MDGIDISVLVDSGKGIVTPQLLHAPTPQCQHQMTMATTTTMPTGYQWSHPRGPAC
jgi:hypothetical protein